MHLQRALQAQRAEVDAAMGSLQTVANQAAATSLSVQRLFQEEFSRVDAQRLVESNRHKRVLGTLQTISEGVSKTVLHSKAEMRARLEEVETKLRDELLGGTLFEEMQAKLMLEVGKRVAESVREDLCQDRTLSMEGDATMREKLVCLSSRCCISACFDGRPRDPEDESAPALASSLATLEGSLEAAHKNTASLAVSVTQLRKSTPAGLGPPAGVDFVAAPRCRAAGDMGRCDQGEEESHGNSADVHRCYSMIDAVEARLTQEVARMEEKNQEHVKLLQLTAGSIQESFEMSVAELSEEQQRSHTDAQDAVASLEAQVTRLRDDLDRVTKEQEVKLVEACENFISEQYGSSGWCRLREEFCQLAEHLDAMQQHLGVGGTCSSASEGLELIAEGEDEDEDEDEGEENLPPVIAHEETVMPELLSLDLAKSRDVHATDGVVEGVVPGPFDE
eukprot:CAMPEP_0194541334 /NCGR_PEP_ID=MMETSP0253-20130528/82021_1 /TAXON_ID=2966 /ORGANISM="Noctiluca scintillans" /LENGTH=448 /DNA_ID=CAMNT_0039387809 /DNA_START=83 /DNA_END=1426 /DNA_ORIENTATION=+